MVFTQKIKGTPEDDDLNGADEGDDFIYGYAGNDILHGFGRNDFMFGGAGTDMLFGGDGTDWLDGGSGADLIDGGSGYDYAVYAASARAIVVSLSGGSGSGSGGAAQGDSYNDIEAIIGSAFADIMTGGSGAQYFQGLDGNDTLSGGTGWDTLDGGNGDDMISGEAGDDLLQGGAGADWIDGGEGHDMAAYYGGATLVDMLHPDRNTGDAAGDVLIGIEGLYGSELADMFYGNAADNTLSGNGGADILHGRGGDDLLRGGTAGDTLYGGSGDDILQGGGSILNGGAGNDELNVAINSFGEFEGQRMWGGAGADIFHTKVLDDTVVRIGDFEPGTDTINLFLTYGYLAPGRVSPEHFVIGTEAADSNDRIIYDPETGRLWFDANGSDDGSQQLVAILTNRAALEAGDLLV